MKMNKKIIVSTLALAMGAALAGSVSGTVAWFQYSTRAQAAYIGTSAHCSEMLEIQATSVGGQVDNAKWKGELVASDIAAVLNVSETVKYGTALAPITSGVMAKNAALPTSGDPAALTMYANPIYQHFGYSEWTKAEIANYAQFDLHFRVKDVNGASGDTLLTKNVYLTNLSIVSLKDKTGGGYEEDTAATSDLYKAIRVHMSAGSGSTAVNALFANDGAAANSAADIETIVSSKLDLNNDGKYDTTAAYSDWETGTETLYGGTAATDKQVAYNINKASTFADDSDPTIPSTKVGDVGSFGQTSSSSILKVTVTIWIEGWQELGTPLAVPSGVTDSANDAQVWDPATYIGKTFGVGMRFAVPAHTAAE